MLKAFGFKTDPRCVRLR